MDSSTLWWALLLIIGFGIVACLIGAASAAAEFLGMLMDDD